MGQGQSTLTKLQAQFRVQGLSGLKVTWEMIENPGTYPGLYMHSYIYTGLYMLEANFASLLY